MNDSEHTDAAAETVPDQTPVQPASQPAEEVAGAVDPDSLLADSIGAALGDDLDQEIAAVTLDSVMAERDSHLADLQRISAEFANFRRQASKRQADTIEFAASGLVEKLLPVLDACDAAVLQGADDVDPIRATLVETLRKGGLELLADPGEPFDPERHDAVLHEQGEGSEDSEATVLEIMRPGYVWKGRVLRPAMVKVQGG